MATRADTELSMPLVWVVPAEPASVGLVRRMLSASLVRTRRARLDDLLLATSELVTNAVLHGEGAVAVTVWPGPVVFRVEVSDDGEGTPQPRRDHQEDDETGRGLLIVAALSTRWGVWPKRHGPGKTVWFEMGQP
jgi:anti-sigma regulatory factor (Ser/Thr protein kinase)